MGCHCPNCGEEVSLTLNTRPVNDGVKRRRQCVSCGERFTTRETLEGTHVPRAMVQALEDRLQNVLDALGG